MFRRILVSLTLVASCCCTIRKTQASDAAPSAAAASAATVAAVPPLVVLLKRIKQHFPDWEPSALLDIGANQGEYAKGMRMVFPTSKILMLEATPQHQETLNQVAMEIGNANAQIEVLSATEGEELSFFQSNAHTGNSVFQENSEFGEKQIPVVRIARTLDNIISDSTFLDENDRIDIIKADVQGSELAVFLGGVEALSEATFVTFEASTIEYNLQAPCLHHVDAFLRSQGFFLYDMALFGYNDAFKTKGVGQFDILYVKPGSDRLPKQLKDMNPRFCGAHGDNSPPCPAFTTTTSSMDSIFNSDAISFVESSQANQYTFMAGTIFGIFVGTICTRFFRSSRKTKAVMNAS